MADRDTILAVLQTGIALAGLLLVFSGFLASKASSFDNIRRGDKYKWLAIGTLIPILGALALSWMSIDALLGCKWEQYHLLTILKIQLAITGAFAIIGLISVVS